VRQLLVLFSLSIIMVACDPSADAGVPEQLTDPRPVPSDFGSLAIRPDTGALIVGRQLRVIVTSSDASGAAADASTTEVTSSNPAIAQWASAIAVPATDPAVPHVYALLVTFDLMSAGSTAIHARLGIFSDSIVITVVPP